MFSRFWLGLRLLLMVFCLGCSTASAEKESAPGGPPVTSIPSITSVPLEAQPSDHFDVEAASNAYLAKMPADAGARSDAYFEGGYWLILWDFLYGIVIVLLLLNLRWSAAMRNLAERVTRFKPVHTTVYWSQYLVLTSIMSFPLDVYEGFFREHKYGLATQTFGP